MLILKSLTPAVAFNKQLISMFQYEVVISLQGLFIKIVNLFPVPGSKRLFSVQ